MSRTTTALVSFIVGASSMFFLLFGSHMPTVAQPVSTQRGIVVRGSEPVIPPLRGIVSRGGTFTNITQPLDGLVMENPTFNNVIIEYSGGAYRLVNPTFSGPIHVNFKGAAANTLALMRFISAIEAQRKPKVLPPNAPIIQLAVIKESISADLISPYGQK